MLRFMAAVALILGIGPADTSFAQNTPEAPIRAIIHNRNSHGMRAMCRVTLGASHLMCRSRIYLGSSCTEPQSSLSDTPRFLLPSTKELQNITWFDGSVS